VFSNFELTVELN